MFAAFKLGLYFLHSVGVKISQLCTHQPSPDAFSVKTSFSSKENVYTSGTHYQNVCACWWKCAPWAPGASLFTVSTFILHEYITFELIVNDIVMLLFTVQGYCQSSNKLLIWKIISCK